MMQFFLFVGLPYAALAILVIGTIVRFKKSSYTVTSLSSQSLESRWLPYGSLAWHAGILIVLGGHLAAFLFPTVWASLTANHTFLIAVEGIGLGAALLCAIGLCILIGRRLTNARLQSVTSHVDLLVLALLLAQVVLGIIVATTMRWGASWSTGTTTPYIYSLFMLEPDVGFVEGMPIVIRAHLVMAWLIFALVPFSRLVHAFTVPIHYLLRAPQKVVWTNRRFSEAHTTEDQVHVDGSRRALVRGAAGVTTAGVLMGAGVAGRAAGFFRGPDLDAEEKEDHLARGLERLKATGEERELELERMRKSYIHVAQLSELLSGEGKYFIDYQMRPAMAFIDSETNLPILLSAKCTHLACTVGNAVNDDGRVACPCHASYFDIRTGEPNSEAPTKTPLPRIGWVIMDTAGEVIATQGPGGDEHGDIDLIKALSESERAAYRVLIARNDEAAAG